MGADATGPFRIGAFEATERLGRGAFASVYRGRDLRSGVEVALKVVPPGTDAETVRRLMREARAVAQITHPNVVRVFECGVVAEGAYVAMELLSGLTLQDVIDQDGALPLDRALPIVVRVLDGLAAAHAHGVVHRDVKPENIFLTRALDGAEVPHLLDFGVSKVGAAIPSTFDDRTLPGTAMGTPGFMAPEQYGQAHAADARADIYGVAATLYTMLTGRTPFNAGSYESWVIKVKGERAPSIVALAPDLPESVVRVIDRALARDPDARWATALEFAQALVGDQGMPPTFESTVRGPSRTHPVVDVGHETRRSSPSAQLPLNGDAHVVKSASADTAGWLNPPQRKLGDDRTPPSALAPPEAALPARNSASPAAVPVLSESDADREAARRRELRTRRRRRASTVWFLSGALAGALLAAIGAALALWVRSHRSPRPGGR